MSKNIEEKIFAAYRPIFANLQGYGFTFANGIYSYSRLFMDDSFLAIISIDEQGNYFGKVIEKELEEEYLPLHNLAYNGPFVSQIREAYEKILLNIREHCFHKVLFVSDQANRISDKIRERYNESPDFPFSGKADGDSGVFRNPTNKKWYGILMNVKKKVFGNFPEDEYVDVLDLKADESKLKETLALPGIFPAYHMNKKKWISVLLDGSLSDEVILNLVSDSRNFVSVSKKK